MKLPSAFWILAFATTAALGWLAGAAWGGGRSTPAAPAATTPDTLASDDGEGTGRSEPAGTCAPSERRLAQCTESLIEANRKLTAARAERPAVPSAPEPEAPDPEEGRPHPRAAVLGATDARGGRAAKAEQLTRALRRQLQTQFEDD